MFFKNSILFSLPVEPWKNSYFLQHVNSASSPASFRPKRNSNNPVHNRDEVRYLCDSNFELLNVCYHV
jgi:hypothetical protein